ncbi:hypothetical protein ACFV1L_31460 [Kitasatospora sp. NPDC059646]|uniref:hypothetical protein n=1 Tax=Kitasatospora sp. NPDC059646 TaxID=3346893 RepID=UPI003689586B
MAQDAGGFLGNITVPLLTAAVTALVGAFWATYQDWRRRRQDDFRRRRALDDAQARVTFVRDWFSTYREVHPDAQTNDPRRRAIEYLDDAFRTLQSALSEPRPRTTRVGLWSRIRTATLLIPLRSWKASLTRLAFYLVIFIVSGVAPRILLDSTYTWANRIGSALTFLVFSGTALYGLWRLARLLADRSAASRDTDDVRDGP